MRYFQFWSSQACFALSARLPAPSATRKIGVRCLTLRSTGPATAAVVSPACGAFGTFARRAYAVCRSGPVSSNVRPQERHHQCFRRSSWKPCSYRACFSPLRMLNNPKLSRATSDSHNISMVKVKTVFANNVPTRFEHRKQRFGCIHRTICLQPVMVHRTLAQSIEPRTKHRLFRYSVNYRCSRYSLTGISLYLLRCLNIVCILNLRPNPSFKRSANGRPPGPRGTVVYPAPRGPGVLPSSPA